MTKDHFKTLRNDHLLFQKLKTENPAWWQFIKKNIKPGGFYVDVRKDNSLNVYYNGGSLAKITLLGGNFNGKMHESYLGKTGSKYDDYDLQCLSEEEAGAMIKKIEKRFSGTSESGIKARLICDPDAHYIDSEFAYPKDIDNDNPAIRIDLTKLESGKIIFVELKRIQDGRLLTDEYEDGSPEILNQMKAYHKFIKDRKQDITDYYKKLFIIKRDLGILPQNIAHIDNIDHHTLSEDIELYIEPYSSSTPARERRVKAIRTILKKNSIINNL